MHGRARLVVAGVLLLLVACVASLLLLFERNRYAVNFRDLLRCANKSNSVQCAREPIKRLISLKPAATVMKDISASFSGQQCHYLGHVVGQDVYWQYGSVELASAQCDRTCDSACLHGVIGQAFAETFGVTDSELDLTSAPESKIREVGKRLCSSPETCHGVGHAAFQGLKNFNSALALCQAISKDQARMNCYSGIFMEYADVLSDRNMRTVSNIPILKESALASFCPTFEAEQRRACFRYFPRTVIQLQASRSEKGKGGLSQVITICTSFKDQLVRSECLAGVGVFNAYSVVENANDGIRTCESLSREVDRASCIVGMISVTPHDREVAVLNFCDAITDSSLQHSCFQGVMYYLRRMGEDDTALRTVCNAHSPACVQEIPFSEKDPLRLVLGIAGADSSD